MNRQRRSFYVLLPLLATLFALLLAEIGLGVFYPIPFSLERNMYFEDDPYTGFRHRPGGDGRYLNGVPARANSRGLRNAEVAIPKPPGLFRILAVGDSFTVGANVEQDEAYPQALDRLLRNQPGASIEVVNTGVGGWGPFQYAQFLEHYGDEYEPDLVLIGLFVGNDLYLDSFRVEDTLTAVLGRRVSRATGQSRFGAVQVWLYEKSHIARLMMKEGFEVLDFDRTHCGEFNNYFLAVQKARMRNHIARPTPEELRLLEGNVGQLERIQRWTAGRGIPLLVFVLPDENQVNPQLQAALLDATELPDYDLDNPQKLLRPLLDARGIAWSDLLQPLRDEPRCLFMNDSHWTAEGHAWVAQYMRDELYRRGVLPGAATPDTVGAP